MHPSGFVCGVVLVRLALDDQPSMFGEGAGNTAAVRSVVPCLVCR